MNNISMNQALSIWSELWQAYYGKNGFGGDTAEIYAYRLMPYVPDVHAHHNSQYRESQSYIFRNMDVSEKAAHSLCELLYAFQKETNCDITIDGESIGDWFHDQGSLFDHRCHVKITPCQQV